MQSDFKEIFYLWRYCNRKMKIVLLKDVAYRACYRDKVHRWKIVILKIVHFVYTRHQKLVVI